MLSFLSKTTNHLGTILGKKQESFSKDQLEELLIECDMDYDVIQTLLHSLPSKITRDILSQKLINLLTIKPDSHSTPQNMENIPTKPEVLLIMGINGAGKTTSIAKLANKYKNDGKSVLLGAGDTFRAAAIEQLQAWGERLQIPVIASKIGGDSSAVCFDSITSAIAKGYDIVILDTAGRLHTRSNLTNELLKIIRISQKALCEGVKNPNATHLIKQYLILDGTQGSSSINQAKHFSSHTKLDGIIITKLDGSSKGGAIFSIVSELQIPVIFLGIGEGAQDLIAFNPQEYVKTLLDCIFSV